MSKKKQEQHSHRQTLPEYDIHKMFAELFAAAKSKDEFEYCCALLRFRGIEGFGWDPLQESNRLLQEMLSLIHTPIESAFRVRLLLFLYCHSIEMHALYHVIANMLMIAEGERYRTGCFEGNAPISSNKAIYPLPKALCIKTWAQAHGFQTLGDLFGDLVVNEIRNAFFHSDYVLTEESFNIRLGNGVKIGNLIDPQVKLEWLIPRLQLGINVALALIECVGTGIRSYTANKIVKGRFPGPRLVDIELTVLPGHGLNGFSCPPKRKPKDPSQP